MRARTALGMAGLLGVGAGTMYLLDPDRGRRRRATLRDKTMRGARIARTALGKTARDIQNRSRGLVHDIGTLFTSQDVSDTKLAERIRSRLGHVVSHPGSITVECRGGDVTLGGIVYDTEIRALLGEVGRVRGIGSLHDRLVVRRIGKADAASRERQGAENASR